MSKVVIGGNYKHFKGHEIKVLEVATHTETGEPLVVYHCNGPHGSEFKGGIYARPYEMFTSEVDKEKYPEVEQKDRFELVSAERLAMVNAQSEDNIYLRVSDIVDIEAIPEIVKGVIQRYAQGMKILDNGLPASGFLGKEGTKITGIFKYGEITFISYVGEKERLSEEEFIHIFSNVSEDDYDALKEMVEQQLKQVDGESDGTGN